MVIYFPINTPTMIMVVSQTRLFYFIRAIESENTQASRTTYGVIKV